MERVQRERSIGKSEAINDLIRAGLVARPIRKAFKQETFPMGMRIDVTNVAEALELLEGPTHRHAEVLGGLIEGYHVRGHLVSDAELAAIAIEHGLVLASADTDFARFGEVTWINPLA